MIDETFYKLLVLTPDDKNTGVEKMSLNRQKKDNMFYRDYSAIVLQDGLTLQAFLGKEYEPLREMAYSVCKSKTILLSGVNKLLT